jgi:hypothetical protein
MAIAVLDSFGTERAHWIAVLDSDFEVVAESPNIERGPILIDWLPAGNAVIFDRQQNEPPGIYDFKRGLLDFPFEAELALAVIP